MNAILKQYAWLIELLAVILCSFFLAKITGVYLGRSLEFKRSIAVLEKGELAAQMAIHPQFSEYQVILERNIFDSTASPKEEGAEGEELVEGETIPTGEAVKTGLDINVIGVLMVGEGKDKRSSATIIGPSKKEPYVYAVGDDESFAPNTKLVMVSPLRIEFLNGGRLEYCEVGLEAGESIFGPPQRGEIVASVGNEVQREEPKGTLIKAEGGGKFTIDQTEIENAMTNLDRLYTDIRAVPNFAGGKVSGMKILSVRAGSIFAKLGLQRGDVLQRINGLDLDVKRGFEIFNQLKDQKTLTLDLIRQGSNQTFEYEIR
ncbi:MAG: type II secretion system protein GspC [Pseudomonadota bacterium]